jgi:uncharacterized protein YqgC (DUF456 family)
MGLAFEVLAWTALVVCCLGGVIGVVLPVVPGAFLILAGAAVHKLMLPGWLSWWTIGVLAVVAVLDRAVDILGTVLGARWAGATRWGLAGAAAGGVVGLFFGLPGLLLGPVIGAFCAEVVFARRGMEASVKSGVGAGIGFGVSTALKVALALFMVVLVAFDLMMG